MNKIFNEQIDQQIDEFLVCLADYYGVEQLTEKHIGLAGAFERKPTVLNTFGRVQTVDFRMKTP